MLVAEVVGEDWISRPDEAHGDAQEMGEIGAQAQVGVSAPREIGSAVEEEVGVDAPVGGRLEVAAVVHEAGTQLQDVAAVHFFLSDQPVVHVKLI